VWQYEDVSMKKPVIQSAAELESLVKRVVRVLATKRHKDLVEEWCSEALSWAISCPNFHLRNRSHQVSATSDGVVYLIGDRLQIYRALSPQPTRESVQELLEALANSLRVPKDPDTLSNALEILKTFQVPLPLPSSPYLRSSVLPLAG
jgi:hypothetical protein